MPTQSSLRWKSISLNELLIAAKLVCSLSPQFVPSFPTSEAACAVKLWPVVNKVKLKSELTTLYHFLNIHPSFSLGTPWDSCDSTYRKSANSVAAWLHPQSHWGRAALLPLSSIELSALVSKSKFIILPLCPWCVHWPYCCAGLIDKCQYVHTYLLRLLLSWGWIGVPKVVCAPHCGLQWCWALRCSFMTLLAHFLVVSAYYIEYCILNLGLWQW